MVNAILGFDSRWGSQNPDWRIGSANLLFNGYTNSIIGGKEIEP